MSGEAEAPPSRAHAHAIASFKLQLEGRRVRVVPRTGLDGSPFTGPGVDLVGGDAEPVLRAAAGVEAWLAAREPGVTVRSISMDLGLGRVLVTYHPSAQSGGTSRPHVLRVTPPLAWELVHAAAPVLAALAPLVRERLAARALTA